MGGGSPGRAAAALALACAALIGAGTLPASADPGGHGRGQPPGQAQPPDHGQSARHGHGAPGQGSVAPASPAAAPAPPAGVAHAPQGKALAHGHSQSPKAQKGRAARAQAAAPTPAQSAVGASTPSAAPASAPSPAPVSSTAPPAPAATVPPAPASTRAARHPHPRRAARHRPHRPQAARHASSPRPGANQLLAPAIRALPAPGPAVRGHRPRPRHARAHHRTPASPGSPLLRTINHFIAVVPLAVKILIGILAALAFGLAGNWALAALRARRLERQRRALMDDVGLLQAALLPVIPQRLGPVAASAAYRPADGPAAGGDFYDVFLLADGRLGVIVGDLSGHGRRALPHTALVRFTLRAYLEAGLSPRGTVRSAAAVLERQLGDSFATVVLATYDPARRELTYASAGHPPPVVLGDGLAAPISGCASPPIGLGLEAGTRQTTVAVPGQALICFYTDGLIEARAGGELFGVDRLVRLLGELGPQAGAAAVLERVRSLTDGRPDDMAACVLRLQGQPAAPRVLSEELEIRCGQIPDERLVRFLRACNVRPGEIATFAASSRVRSGRGRALTVRVDFEGPERRLSVTQDEVVLMPVAAHHAPERRRIAT